MLGQRSLVLAPLLLPAARRSSLMLRLHASEAGAASVQARGAAWRRGRRHESRERDARRREARFSLLSLDF